MLLDPTDDDSVVVGNFYTTTSERLAIRRDDGRIKESSFRLIDDDDFTVYTYVKSSLC